MVISVLHPQHMQSDISDMVQVGSKKYAGFDEDFATVNPYLGSDGVKPFIDVCKEEKKGLVYSC